VNWYPVPRALVITSDSFRLAVDSHMYLSDGKLANHFYF